MGNRIHLTAKVFYARVGLGLRYFFMSSGLSHFVDLFIELFKLIIQKLNYYKLNN